MDTVMVLSVLNGGLPIGPVVETGPDMRRTCVPNDKCEHAWGLTNLLSDYPDMLEELRASYKESRT